MNNIFDLSEENPQRFDNISKLNEPNVSFGFLNDLNREQKSAVMTTGGPVLVLSGAGTGKTKVLTTRLAYILGNQMANPWNCLVVTFTNRAAQEMKKRAVDMIGDIANSVWLGTFHSIGVKILRVYPELVGLKSNFTILDTDDQKRLIKQILEAEGIDDKKYPPQSILDAISRWKDKGITPDKMGMENKNNNTANVYKLYQKRLLELNCVDFGDILLHTLSILMNHKEVLEKYQNQFKYIMVDEYQDTNVTQYLLLRLLSQKHRNICCVGDDDQSIYSWRGAEIENILRFEKDFSDAKIVRLEQNYRSTANILSAASNLISFNDGRLGKTLKVAENSPANKVDNKKIKVVSNYNGEDEAGYIVEEIESVRRIGYKYSDCAVLVRTAFQTREFEEKFIKEAIPYKVIGGLKFYERAEIRDALAYLRIIYQPDDDLALMRIINKPTRGIGAKSLEKISNEARYNQSSMYVTIKKMIDNGDFAGKLKTSMSDIMKKFEDWRKLIDVVSPDEIASQVLEDSGYIDMLKAEKSPESAGRIENLTELVNVIGDEEKYPDLATFLEHVSLVIDKDDALDNDKVMLITLHSAKGLEFDVVFLPGWEEGLFPHQRALDEGGKDSLEEERRLAYVAITRAKKELYILTAKNRRLYGQWQQNIPSRFLNELPPKNIEISSNSSRFFGQNQSSFSNKNWSKPKNSYIPKSKNVSDDNDDRYSYEAYDDAETSVPVNKLIGTKVSHETFGIGKITAVEGSTLHIYFEKYGHKKILRDYVRKVL